MLSHSLRITALVTLTAGLLWGLWELGPYRAIVIVMMFLFVAGHELCGHLLEMRKRLVPVEEVGIGIPRGPFRYLQVELPTPNVPFRVMISPLVISAYVDEGEAGKSRLEQLPHSDKAVIFGAGVSFNLIVTVLLWATLGMYEKNQTPRSILFMILGVLIAFLLVVRPLHDFPAAIMGYVFPVMGLVLLGYIAWLVFPPLFTDFGTTITHGGTLPGSSPVVLGPITVAKLVGGTQSALQAHVVLLLLSAGITTANLLPIKQLDGGQIAESLLSQWFSNRIVQAILWVITVVVGGALVAILLATELGIAALITTAVLVAAWLYDKHQKKRVKAQT